MMISPGVYYKMQLEGKSVEEIKTNIRGLKRRINYLKRVLEHPNYTSTFHPSEDVQLEKISTEHISARSGNFSFSFFS